MSNMLKDQHDRTKLLSLIYGRESTAHEGSHFTPDGVNADAHTQWQLNVFSNLPLHHAAHAMGCALGNRG